MYDFNILDYKKGDQVTDVFLVKEKKEEVARNGKNYLSITLSNMHGNCNAKVWNATEQISEIFDNKVVMIKGKIDEFNGTKQIIISNQRVPSEDQYEINKLIKSSKFNEVDMWNYIYDTIVNEVEEEEYKQVTLYLLDKYKDKYMIMGAAKVNHHNYSHGLLEHNYCILKAAKFMAEMYSSNLNKSRLYCGAILHDIGKIIELHDCQHGVIDDFTTEGHLLGHLVIGVQEISKACMALRNNGINISDKTEMLLSHIIISHHSEPDFGSPRRPSLKEAELIYRLDSIDCFMQIFDNVIDKLESNKVSDRQYNLGGRIIAKFD